MAKIVLERIKVYAHHGVLEEETLTGTYYRIDLEIDVDLSQAAKSDELSDTVNYALVNELILEEMKIPSKLLEHVAGRILNRIHETFPTIEALKIKLLKTAPPMKGEMEGVGVILEERY